MTKIVRFSDILEFVCRSSRVRMENGVLAEHWDVIQDEATRAQSKSGNPMFGDEFPAGAK
jgi:predicted SnoaL-like aldol condensation-catalyzing enzyme